MTNPLELHDPTPISDPVAVLWEAVTVLEGVRVTLQVAADTANSRCEHDAALRCKEAAARVIAVQQNLTALTTAGGVW
jgi:hypothetical protein